MHGAELMRSVTIQYDGMRAQERLDPHAPIPENKRERAITQSFSAAEAW